MSEIPIRPAAQSGRPGGKNVFCEAGALLLAGAVLALAANQFSPRGLNLTREYFPQGAKAAATPAVATNAAPAPDTTGVPPEITARLQQKGLQPLGHAQTVALFQASRSNTATLFVDARDDEHYQAGHIPGAYQFDSYHQEKYLLTVLPPCLAATTVVVYCTGGDCEDSESAALTLNMAGVPLDHLRIYAGGITAWSTNGLPVETGDRNSGTMKPAKP